MAAWIYIITTGHLAIPKELLIAKELYMLKYRLMEQKINVITLESVKNVIKLSLHTLS